MPLGEHWAGATSGVGQGKGLMLTDAGLASPEQPPLAGVEEAQRPEQRNAPADAAAPPCVEEREASGTGQGEGLMLTAAGLASPAQPPLMTGAEEGQAPKQYHAHANAEGHAQPPVTGAEEGRELEGNHAPADAAGPAQPPQTGAEEGREPEQNHAPADAAAPPHVEERKPGATPAASEGKRRRGRPPGSRNRKTIARMEAARMLQVWWCPSLCTSI